MLKSVLKYVFSFFIPFFTTFFLLFISAEIRKPDVSILLYTSNANTSILKQTIQSILNQSLKDFELYIIEDGVSLNQSKELLIKSLDKKIQVITIPQQKGKEYFKTKFMPQLNTKKKLFIESEDILPTDFLSKHIHSKKEIIPSPVVMHLIVSFNDDYFTYQQVSIASLLYTSLPDEEFNIYIFDPGISEKNKKKMENLKKIKNFNITYIVTDTPYKQSFDGNCSNTRFRMLWLVSKPCGFIRCRTLF